MNTSALSISDLIKATKRVFIEIWFDMVVCQDVNQEKLIHVFQTRLLQWSPHWFTKYC